ncbi:MAG TPA: MgtC/SapB family protein [Actinomycetota bacterium]|nr:MgtC/SapB family protein [Actinomycetota bacterium]
MMGGVEWDAIGSLVLAFGLASIVGFERELRKKDAGLRTHTLVGVGAALFTLAGRFGFPESTTFDASRIAAQVASGIGFIGAGVIFLRRDVVRGLTTAATIWVVAAIGLAAGAGGDAAVLAVAATLMHLIVAFVFTPILRRMPVSRFVVTTLEVSYHDGRGVLRDILETTTDLGYVITNLDVGRKERDDDIVPVTLDAEGKGDRHHLVESIQRLDGVAGVRVSEQVE